MNTPKRTGLKGVVATVTLFILLQIITTSGQNGVQLMFLGNALANHGFVLRGQIGDNQDDSDAVRVETDNPSCCTASNGLSTGNWFYPNGTAVPTRSIGYNFLFNRRTQSVPLSRIRGGVNGIYLCSGVPDAGGTNRNRYVGIYTASSGRPVINSIAFNLLTDLNAVTPRFVLTCISQAGPVEQSTWFRDGNELQDGSTYDIPGSTVVNTTSAEYHHPLTVTGRFPDTYTCRVLSTRPAEATPSGEFTDTMNIDIVAANPPTIVSVRGVRGARVRWTIPTGGATEYRIYYQQVGGSDSGFEDVEDGGATEATLTVQVGLTYTINMVALSQHLPSALSNSMTVVIVIVATPVITMVRSTSSTSITVVWTQDDEEGDVDSFEIAYVRVTGAMQLGPCPSAEDSDTVTVSDGTARQQTVSGLEEFSTYSFTVTAISSDERSFPSDSMTNTTQQAAPSGPPEAVRAVTVTSTSITVAWNPVNCIDRNSEITQYTISFCPESMPDDRDTMTVSGSGDTGGMETISPLLPFTSYSIEVAAVNSGGQTGVFSDAIVVATEQDVPSEVRDLQATTDFTSIAVSWTEPEALNGILTAYEVCYQQLGEEGRELRNITDTAITSTVLSGLIPGTTYTISVRARTIAGPGEEESVMATTPIIPEVQNVRAQALSETEVEVTWDPIDDISLYRVFYRVVDDVRRQTGGQVDVSMPRAVISNLTMGVEHQFTVASLVEVNGSILVGEVSQPNADSRAIPTPPPDGGGGGDNAGAIAGGVIAAVVVVALVAAIVIVAIWLWRRYSTEKDSYSPSSPLAAPQESVHYVNVAQRISVEKPVGPVVLEFPADVRVTEGEGVIFQVRVSGVPSPTLVWYHNGNKVLADYSIELGEDGSLTYPSAESRHTGVYKLVASNSAGTKEREVRLDVYPEGEPTPAMERKTMDLQPVPVGQFGKYVAELHGDNNKGFRDQYDALETGAQHPVTIATTPENRPLNRFLNITVYDDNSIKLKPIAGQKNCQREYINACYVDGYTLPRKYIATQGPLPKTLIDFWRLVWQERPTTIVMITNLKEGNKIKCQHYWPETRSKNFGPFHVTITDQQTFADYTIRAFKVDLSGSSERSLKVNHFQFTAWPDHGVPDYATPILAFHRRVKTQHNPSRGPLLVHCSAGVGRTGTYITIDHVLEQVEREEVVDIAGVINRIRQQRMKLVQTVEQYVFIHDAILESVTCGDTQIPATDLRAVIHKLDIRDRQTRQTGFQSQFHVLNQVTPRQSETRKEMATKHYAKNRSMEYVPSDRWRVPLRGEHPDYIHANFANGYKQQKTFIIAQGPLQTTCRDFWKMVHERGCGAIVMLSELREEGKEVCYKYWPVSGTIKFGDYIVDLLGEEKLEGFILRTLSVLETKSGKAHQVTQFHIVNWAPDGRCSNLQTVTDVIEEVAKVQRRTGNQPIVVHCSDTVSRSGMFCAIATTIERCKTEGVVDVFQVVKALRVQKPEAVLTVDQYHVVFEAVLVFIDSFDTYANFQDI